MPGGGAPSSQARGRWDPIHAGRRVMLYNKSNREHIRAVAMGLIHESAIGDPFGGKHVRFSKGDTLTGTGVYGLACVGTGRIKIGCTDKLLARITDISHVCPLPVQLRYWIRSRKQLEREIHKKLHAHRLHMEWFADSPEVNAVLLDHVKTFGGAWTVDNA